MHLPHSPSLEKDSNSEYRSGYTSKLMEWRDVTKSTALGLYRQSPEYGLTQQYIQFLENNSFDQRRPGYRAQYKNNKMGLARRDRLAKMTDSRPLISVDSNIAAYEESAGTIEGVIRAEWLRQNMANDLVSVYDMASLHGTAFWKIGAAKNKLIVTSMGPDQVIPINPSLKSIQDSSVVLQRGFKSINYIKGLFPVSSAGIEETARSMMSMGDKYNRPNNIDQTTWEGMSTPLKRMLSATAPGTPGMAEKLYGVAELEQYYIDDRSVNESSHEVLIKDPFLSENQHNWWYKVKPGERLYPRKRLVVFGGSKLLYDGPSPYWHGMYPFACLRTNPVSWSWYGLSIYRDLLPLQKAINEIPSGIMDMVRKAINPPIIANQRDVSPSLFQQFAADMPGAKFLLNPGAEPERAFYYQQPPQLPAYVANQQQVTMGDFDRMSGSVDINALTGKNQVPGGDTIDQMRDSLQTSMRLEERYLESFLNDAGIQSVSNVIQFYDAKQRLKMLGADGITPQDFLVDPGKLHPSGLNGPPKEYFWKMFGFQVTPGSLHAGAKDKTKIEAVGLASRQLISRKEMYRMFGWDKERIDRVIEELKEEAAFMAQMQGAEAGGTRTPRSPADRQGVGV